MEPFTVVEETPDRRLFDTYERCTSGLTADHDAQYQAALQQRFPDLSVTAVPTQNCNILGFAAAGHADAELDTSTDPVARWRGWVPSYGRKVKAGIGETVFFAKYKVTWKGEYFILYAVDGIQYLLKDPVPGEHVTATPRIVDELISTVGTWQSSNDKVVWVYEQYWRQDPELFESVEKTSWDKVILDEDMKRELTDVASKFFDNEEIYKQLGVPWKRGLIFHGPPGNGKTISIKALMHTLNQRSTPIPSLYVKDAPYTFDIGEVFSFARQCSPCLLIFEDVETLVNVDTRSYFLNEIDGLSNNDGILMVASTNFLDRLDPGLTKRPSRFDRLFLFPLPKLHERTLYAEYWRRKINAKDAGRVHVDFPERLCPAMAAITKEFSFAYMQEAFVASLLTIARDSIEKHDSDFPAPSRIPHTRSPASQALYNALNPYDREAFDELDQYKLWCVFKEQVRTLRSDMDNTQPNQFCSSAPAAERPHRPLGQHVLVSPGTYPNHGPGGMNRGDLRLVHPRGRPVTFDTSSSSGVHIVQDSAADGAAGRKWPSFNTTAFQWGI